MGNKKEPEWRRTLRAPDHSDTPTAPPGEFRLPNGVITYHGKLTPKQFEALRRKWRDMFKGTAGAWKIPILESGREFYESDAL
jgi:hypothetical protein